LQRRHHENAYLTASQELRLRVKARKIAPFEALRPSFLGFFHKFFHSCGNLAGGESVILTRATREESFASGSRHRRIPVRPATLLQSEVSSLDYRSGQP
jgi:hypothetical protein